MSQATIYTCNICSFQSVLKDGQKQCSMGTWVSVSMTVMPAAGRPQDPKGKKEWRAISAEIKEKLGGRKHICPGCIGKIRGQEINLRMIGGPNDKANQSV